VLIFEGWTAVISVGLLLFFFIRPWWIPMVLILLGLVACTFVTLAPLSRRKRFESAVQSATANPALEQYDPLDRASAVFDDEIPVPEDVSTRMAATSPPSRPSSQPEKK
jgi:UDP-GlcNAc:undecaprenyl-phosphate GlcNAc-1-phosphate transferase